MVYHQKILNRLPYLDNAIFKPSKIKLVLAEDHPEYWMVKRFLNKLDFSKRALDGQAGIIIKFQVGQSQHKN